MDRVTVGMTLGTAGLTRMYLQGCLQVDRRRRQPYLYLEVCQRHIRFGLGTT